MAKIAIVNIGMHGHVNPTLGFTEALVHRGHTVLYYGSADFAPQIQRTGARFIDYPTAMGHLAVTQAKTMADTGAKAWQGVSIHDSFTDELSKTLPTLLSAFAADRPDVVVYNFIALAGRAAAHHLGIPAVKFFTTYTSNESYDLMAETMERRLSADPAAAAAAAAALASAQLRCNDVCHSCGVPSIDLASLMNHAEAANLVFLPRHFQPCCETFDQRYHFVGPCLRSTDLISALDLVPPGTDPLAIVSLGSLFHTWPDFYKICLEYFAGKPWRVVMGIGPEIRPESLGELPANVRLASHLPQVALLHQADLFVSHGGMNSTMEALSLGVPLVVIPQMEEQELTAQQVDALGLGRFLPRAEVNVDSLAAAISYAVTPAVRANLDTMQEALRVAGGIDRAVAVIEAAPRPSVTPGNFVNLTRTPAPR